jgi:hypothetical protein
MRKQIHADTWQIGDYLLILTKFEGDDNYEWETKYSPMGYGFNGTAATTEAGIRSMLDIAEQHTGGVLVETYTFDMPGENITISCTPQTTIETAFRQAIEENNIRVAYEDWTLESKHGIHIDNPDLHIGVFSDGIIASINPVTA